MLKLKYITNSLFICLMAVFIASCSNKSYPCPGLGQSSSADLSMFDENGELKGKKKKGGRIDKSTGMVNKKNPKQIRKKRKKRL